MAARKKAIDTETVAEVKASVTEETTEETTEMEKATPKTKKKIKVKVVRTFKDKETEVIHSTGEVIEVTPARFKEINTKKTYVEEI